jgi:hypothetical protein
MAMPNANDKLVKITFIEFPFISFNILKYVERRTSFLFKIFVKIKMKVS